MANIDTLYKGEPIVEHAFASPYANIDDNYSSDPNSIYVRNNSYLNNNSDDNTFMNSIRQAREAEAYKLFKDFLDEGGRTQN